MNPTCGQERRSRCSIVMALAVCWWLLLPGCSTGFKTGYEGEKRYIRIGTPQELVEVLREGKRLVLDDGSMWEVFGPGEDQIVKWWIKGSTVTVTGGDVLAGRYTLERLSGGQRETIQATYLGQK